MGILDVFGKKHVGKALTAHIPYAIKLRFVPFRLAAHRSESVDLVVGLKNLTEESLLTSVIVEVPKGLGFDQTGLSTAREIRLGYLGPKENKELVVPVFGSTRTDGGEYPVTVAAYCHYRDYAHVLNSEKKKIELRVVE